MASSDSITSKICTKCGIDKPLTDYYPSPKGRFGRHPQCAECKRAYSREYGAKHAEKYCANAIAWRKNNKERAKLKEAAWRERNRSRTRAALKKWRDSDHGKNYMRAYLEKYRLDGKRKLAGKRYYEKNKDSYRAYSRNRRARLREAEGSHSADDISRLFSLQKGKCVYCNARLPKNKFHVDHITALANGGSNLPDNLQITCSTCNKKKGSKDPVDFAQEQGKLL